VIEDGIRCIHFTADAGNLKTQASKRLVPIHDHLVASGLFRLIEQVENKSSEKLFPELANGREGPGQTASKWFSRYRKRCGIEDPKKTFHSFRHTVATRLSYRGCQDYEIADVLGHKTSMITTSRYRDRMLPSHLHTTIHKLKFPFIPPWPD
jgi:integrase